MSLLVKETAGDTLVGVVDSANRSFTTSFDIDTTFVNVYLNGMLMQADLETGYDIIPPRTIVFKEPPLKDPDFADTVEIEYKATGVKTGGGALGGCPDAPQISQIAPKIQSNQNTPDIVSKNLGPRTESKIDKPATVTTPTLQPSMLGNGGI